MSKNKVPERRCIGCMQVKPKNELLRLVAGDGGLHIDIGGKMPGRGAYLCRNSECAKLALKKNAFGRNLKTEVSRSEAESLVEKITNL